MDESGSLPVTEKDVVVKLDAESRAVSGDYGIAISGPRGRSEVGRFGVAISQTGGEAVYQKNAGNGLAYVMGEKARALGGNLAICVAGKNSTAEVQGNGGVAINHGHGISTDDPPRSLAIAGARSVAIVAGGGKAIGRKYSVLFALDKQSDLDHPEKYTTFKAGANSLIIVAHGTGDEARFTVGFTGDRSQVDFVCGVQSGKCLRLDDNGRFVEVPDDQCAKSKDDDREPISSAS